MITAALLVLGLTIDQAAAQAYCKKAHNDVLIVGFNKTYSPLNIGDACNSAGGYATGLVPGCLVNTIQKGNLALHATCVKGSLASTTCQFSGNPYGIYIRFQGSATGFLKETTAAKFATDCPKTLGAQTIIGSSMSFATVSYPSRSVVNSGINLLGACYTQEKKTLARWSTVRRFAIQSILIGNGVKSWQITPSIVGMDRTLSSFDASSVRSTVSSRYTANKNIAPLVSMIPTAARLLACSLKTVSQQSLLLGQCTATNFCPVR